MRNHRLARIVLKYSLLFVPMIAAAQGDFAPVNLGKNINTEFVDGSPLISPDGKTLFFVRDDKLRQGKTDYDIWYSELRQDGTWGAARKMDGDLNNDLNNRVLAITPDGNTLYLSGLYGAMATDQRGISVVRRTRKGWTEPVALKFEKTARNWGSFDMTLNSDERVMILSLNANLYVSFLGTDGIWSEPMGLGRTLNTDNYEYTPFLAADNKTLYFSSGGHNSMGENDIFRTTRLDSTWLNWSPPENMGPPINSPEWESYFRISAAGDYAYVLSWKDGFGKADIFRIKLKEEQRPDPVVLVTGRVLDANTRQPIEATIRYEVLGQSGELGTASTDPSSGEYKIVLQKGRRYGFYADARGYMPVNDNLDLSALEDYREVTRDLLMVPIREGSVIRLNNIFFPSASAELQPESFSELDRVVDLLKENKEMNIEVAGHTDIVGNDADNLALSRDRARSVAIYLASKGIDPKRMISKGYGKRQPIASNDTEEGRQQNRRVEFKIISR